jgi:hypothetical protein
MDNKLPRYEVGDNGAYPLEDGDWCLASDVKALEAENAALKAQGPVLSEAEVSVLEYIKYVLPSLNYAVGAEVIGNLLERVKR